MISRRRFFHSATALAAAARQASAFDSPLDPTGKLHIPIGIPDSLDTLKTFVEAEGNFSPGFGSYGIYFWIFDEADSRIVTPSMVPAKHGLHPPGLPIPWTEWRAGDVEVHTEVCEVRRQSPMGAVYVVAARAKLTNIGHRSCSIRLIAALRPIGAAGGPVNAIAVESGALMVDGHPALVPSPKPSRAGVSALDNASVERARAASSTGDCSGALHFNVTLKPGESTGYGFICPVLPGRRAARHQWADVSQNAMVDNASLNPASGGELQPDPGLSWYQSLNPDRLLDEAVEYWRLLAGRIRVATPDPRWGECITAILSHAALCMNEGAPDVAVINYNVFNRDGMYLANILQKSGVFDLSRKACDYFLSHPFNGRAYPEADNPGQILWTLAAQWQYARDREWLGAVYPAARQIAAMITYYRTTPSPHWVSPTSLEFGDALPRDKRVELKPGRCDGFHPEYTEAFDIAGLRAAALLASALNNEADLRRWQTLADQLMSVYDEKYGPDLRAHQYANYCVLWPCALYPYDRGRAWQQFKSVGAQQPGDWRYFPLATAHQGLLAGNREVGYRTLEAHLNHPQMQGWYAFDEYEKGPGSASGLWPKVRTRWPNDSQKPGENRSVAMPHGWAIAEMWLLMRDALVYERGNQLVLLAGIAPEWFRHRAGLELSGFQTHFGQLELKYRVEGNRGMLEIAGAAAPPDGFVLRLPEGIHAEGIASKLTNDYVLPRGTRSATLRL